MSEALQRYVDRVMALKEEREAHLSADELRAVALEIGLSEEDLAAVEETAANHFLRGQGFLDHGRFDDAIGELTDAVGVAPRRVEWLHALARAHAGRWRERGDEADRDRAEVLARECLELDPRHHASIEVLDDLDRAPQAPPPAPRRRNPLVPLLTAIAPLLAVVLLIVLRSSDDGAPPEGVPVPQEAVAPPAGESPAGEAAASELDVPVDLDPGTTGLELALDVRRSRLQRYAAGKSFYTLNAVLANRGTTELDKVAVRLELLDEAGRVVEQDEFEAVSGASPVLRPGDVEPLHRLREAPDTVRRARLAVVTVDQNPAAAAYAEGGEIVFDWRTQAPDDVSLTLRERSYRFSENTLAGDGSGYFDLVVEVENTGGRTLRGLKLSARILGPEEAWTVAEENHVVTASGPAMRPGEVWLERFIEKVEARPEGYRMFVVDVR